MDDTHHEADDVCLWTPQSSDRGVKSHPRSNDDDDDGDWRR